MPKKKTTKKAVKKKASVEKKSSKGSDRVIAIVGLILNILILPGLGSLIGGKIKAGIWQLILFLGGIVIGIGLTITIVGAVIGIPVMIILPLIAWIWGLITGIKMIQESN